MPRLSFIVFSAGLIVATCFAVKPVSDDGSPEAKVRAYFATAGLPFGLGIALLVAGGWVARRQSTQTVPSAADRARAAERVTLDPRAVAARMAERLETLRTPLSDLAATRRVIDLLAEADVDDFLRTRPRLRAELGPAGFALLSGHLARMERNLARAWSAATDEALEEVEPCLDRARAALSALRAQLGEDANSPNG